MAQGINTIAPSVLVTILFLGIQNEEIHRLLVRHSPTKAPLIEVKNKISQRYRDNDHSLLFPYLINASRIPDIRLGRVSSFAD